MRSVSNGVSRYFAYTNQSVYQNSKAFLSNGEVRQKRRMLSDVNQNTKNPSMKTTSINSILGSIQSYSDTLRMQKQQSNATALKLKKLKYHFKNISSKILSSKTSVTARQVASQARREVLRLKREKQNEKYDSEEIEAAITHAKAMERVAKKKAKHLEEEEMAKASGGPCAGNMVNEEESVRIADKEYELSEEFLCNEETFDDISDMEEFSEETFDDILDMVDFSEEIKGMLEDVNDMLEEIGLDELLDSPVSEKGDMDPADIKAMKIKHRNKEMKDIVKADAEYLKAVFEHLEQMKEEGMVSGNANATTQAVPSAIGMAGSVSEPVINIQI